LPYQNPENAFRVISGDFVTTEDGRNCTYIPTLVLMMQKVATPEIPPMLV
jgi:isoleucyl-tRNA synthetase